MNLPKFGVVGCGDVAFNVYLPAIRSLVGRKLELVAVCDVSKVRAERAMKQFGAKELYLDFNKMLEKANLDAVVNLTSAGAHYPFNMAALKAGKHVFCEKPMATTLEQANELVEQAEKSKVKLAAAPAEMLNPRNQMVKDIIDKGVIGKVCFVRTHCSHAGAGHGLGRGKPADPSWYYMKEQGGGPMFDLAVYGLHRLTGILGPVKRVTCFSGLAIPERKIYFLSDNGEVVQKVVKGTVDDNTMLILDWGNATFGLVDATHCVVAAKGPSTEFYGSRGTINMGGEPPLEVYTEKDEEGIRGWFVPRPPLWAPPIPESWNIGASMEHLADCIIQDKKPVISGEHARHVIEIIVKAYKAAETGKAQDVTTEF